MSQVIFWIIIAFILIGFILDQGLNYLSEKGWDTPLPDFIKGSYTDDLYKKAKNYHQAGDRLALIRNSLTLIVLLAILFLHAFNYLDEWIRTLSENNSVQMLLFFAVLFFAADILSLPFQWYNTFTIEEKYGFNKTTPALFITDKIKSWALATILGGAILWLIFKIYEWSQDYFWLLAWSLISLVSIFMVLFYTKLLLPIFNKLSPLEDGELKNDIEKMAKETGFTLDKIMVMDGSKRSSKANAFFSGLGKQKSIVLYDTLIEQHTNDELLAVLAHEIGHYKLKHIPKSLIINLIQSLLTFYILGVFLKYPVFSEAIGFSQPSFYASLIAFGLLFSPIELISGSFSNMLSRKNEYEADAFAKDKKLGDSLISALIKMSVHHLSNLYPHRFDIFINYSHPTLLQRISHLNKNI